MNPQNTGRAYWRSLDELADTPEFRQFLDKEFADYSPQQIVSSPSRRAFMKIMGASMALAGAVGLPGCRRWPEKKLAPYAKRPEDRIPGVPEQYATIYELGGVARPLLVSSSDGRPNKVEGNPTHPQSQGAADLFAQASVLGMYDPNRSRYVSVKAEGGSGPRTQSTWDDFGHAIDQARAKGGQGFAILCEATDSPTIADLRKRLAASVPNLAWYTWEPLTDASEVDGAQLAFGRPVRTMLHLDKAKVIACFDADILGGHPASLRYSRDWARGRNASSGDMNRMYVAQSHFSITGTNADVRLPVASSSVGDLLRAVAAELGSNAGHAAKLSEPAAKFVHDLVADLKAHRGASVIVAGPSQPAEVHALVHLLNEQLGNAGTTVSYLERPEGGPGAGANALRQIAQLSRDMAAGKVQTLLILGGNPVYDAPADLNFAASLAKVPLSIHLSHYEDETSKLCTWHLPRSHYFEAWGDGRSWDGLVSVQQPLIMPLYATRAPIEVLAILAADAVRTGYDLVRRTFADSLPAGQFEKAWRQVLHDGLVPGSEYPRANVKAQASAAPAQPTRSLAEGEFELVLLPDSKLYDGRFANNPWLQELPDPLSKITWDNAAWIAPITAKRLDVSRGDMIRIEVADRAIDVPVFIMPGQNPGTITLSLGYGRNSVGYVGNGVGFDAYQVRTTDAMWIVPGVKVTPTGKWYELITTQDHFAIDWVGFAERERRVFGNLIRSATLDEYKHKDPHASFDDPHVAAPAGMHAPTMESPAEASAAIGRTVPLQLWDAPVEYQGHAWGMAIDLNKCIGCGACVVACQAENNIPVVGKQEVKRNREMHWIRIDRYFSGDPAAAESMNAVHQPVTCHHCETAPCESVCPVAATVHDTEGLNVMVYNRCVGTRYCSNNCPYKVRRFNWFDWHSKPVHGDMFSGTFLGMPDQQQLENVDPVRRMGYNPEVTVRMRGIMEKCTFCTQRIKAATIPAKNEWTQGKRETWRVNDGEIVPACAQTCPTEAILFGDLNNPRSRVREAYQSDRAYEMLKELNVRARNRYMALISNPSPSFADAVPSSIQHHGEHDSHEPKGHGPATSEKHG